MRFRFLHISIAQICVYLWENIDFGRFKTLLHFFDLFTHYLILSLVKSLVLINVHILVHFLVLLLARAYAVNILALTLFLTRYNVRPRMFTARLHDEEWCGETAGLPLSRSGIRAIQLLINLAGKKKTRRLTWFLICGVFFTRCRSWNLRLTNQSHY